MRNVLLAASASSQGRSSKATIIFIIITLLSTATLKTDNDGSSINSLSFFNSRSQGTNAARDSAGTYRFRMQKSNNKAHGYVSATPFYTGSLRSKRIAYALFNTNTLSITGSMVPDRDPEDLLADYFGLSPTFASTVRFEPHVKNALMVFNGYLALDNWLHGLYLEAIVPAGWTQWHLKLHEEIINNGSDTEFPAQYMAVDAIAAPITSFKKALSGTVEFGQMNDPIAFGKISSCPLSTRGVTDCTIALGWYFIDNELGHMGISLRTSLPAGTRPESKFLFEPLLGNNKHVEWGIGLDGHVILWEKDGTQELNLYGCINGMHLFKARQHRSFDLKNNKALNRYMLLKKFDEQGNYTNMLTPLINHTTLPCTVSIDLQTDIVIMFDYIHKGYTCDVGYNGFIRSKEKIKLRNKSSFPEKTFGIKGIQNVATPLGPDNSTQSTATIFGNNFDQQTNLTDPLSPVFISVCDINTKSAASSRIITHKFFANIGYVWHTYARTQPFFNIGAEIEFEGINPRNQTQPVHDTLALWGIWIKGGIAL